MVAFPSRTARTRECAATLRLAASSVALVPTGYESTYRPWDAGVSRLASTIGTGGDRG
jgi:hypothetical protein